MQIINDSITFSPDSGKGPRTITKDVTFTNNITVATAVLTGMNVEYSKNEDHNFGNLQVRVSAAKLNDKSVRVSATYGLRDWSGNWDDQYDGQVFFSVIGA